MLLALLRSFGVTIICTAVVTITAAQDVHVSLHTGEEFDAVEWSPDGELIAAAGTNEIIIYSPTLTPVATLNLEGSSPTSVSWNPDGTRLAVTGSLPEVTRIYTRNRNTDEYAVLMTLPNPGNYPFATSAAWSPDGSRLALYRKLVPPGRNVAHAALEIWNTMTWQLETTSSYRFSEVSEVLAWSPDSTMIGGVGSLVCPIETSTCNNYDSVFFVIDAQTGDVIWTWWATHDHHDVAWSDDNVLALSTSNSIELLSTGSWEIVYQYEDLPNFRIDWLPLGRYLAGVGINGLEIMDTEINAVVATFELLSNDITHVDWNHRGELVLASADGFLQLYDISAITEAE